MIHLVSVSYIFDHFAEFARRKLNKPILPRKKKASFIMISERNIDSFCKVSKDMEISLNTMISDDTDVSELVSPYDSVLSSLLDVHAPI